VIDPEEVLATLEVQVSREQADAANSAAFHGTLVILSAVADVATVASGHADRHTGLGTAAAVDLMEGDAAAHNSSLGSLSSQQEFWSNEVLRRTTVFPGHGTAGRIYVPINLRATVVWIHVRAAGHTFSIPFRQQVTRLVPATAAPPRAPAGY
jgi:hypothetical protein